MNRYVVCFGAINLDLFYEVLDLEGFLAEWGSGLSRGGEEVISPEKEARLLELLSRCGQAKGRFPGGQAATTAYALGCLGIPVSLLGRVGADADGEFLRAHLEGVDLSHLTPAGKSGRAYILLDPGGDRTVLSAPQTNGLELEDIPLKVAGGAVFVHLTSFTEGGPLQVQRQVAERLAGKLRITFDPGEGYARLGREALEDILDHTETLLVTDTEWRLLGGELRGHPDWAPPVVLVKRGHQGTRMLTPVRYLDFPPYVPEGRADSLGGGEVFAAGYIAGLFQGLNLPQAVRLGSALAAFKLAGPDRERYPDRRLMDAVVSSLR